MTPVFLELHPDEGGTLIVDVLDISRVGPAHGAAKGCSALFKGDHKTVGFKEDIKVIKDAMKGPPLCANSGAAASPGDDEPGDDERNDRVTPNAPDHDAPTARICIVPFELIQPVALEWLWDGRIPRGKLCVVAGDPGLGKSYLTLYMAAVLSRGGEWPDGSRAARENVLIVSAEDDAADTIRPRLDRLGADPRPHLEHRRRQE